MKKRFFSLFVCTALLLSVLCSAHTAWAASSSGDGDTYTDPETGATFIVPEGWEVDEFNREGAANTFQAKFISLNDPGSTLLYGRNDLWNEMTASERSGLTRSEIDSAYLYADKTVLKAFADMASQEGLQTSEDAIQLVTYGRNECIELSAVKEIFGLSVPITMTWYIENGYAYIFMVFATGDQVSKDFQSVLSSLQVPEMEDPSEQNASSPTLSELLANDGLHPLTFLLNLLLTFSVYTLPILVYRFALHAAPLEKKRARKIAIIYGICAYLLMCVITALLNGHAGIAIVFWSYVNYGILISGRKPEPDPADTLAEYPDRLPPATQPPAPQTPPAAPAVPSFSADAPFIPAAAAPQTPPSPAAYTPAPAAAQTPPAAQRGTSAPSADPASMWPTQYHSAQDMRVGSPKQRGKASASTPVPAAPFIPAAAAPQTPPSTTTSAPARAASSAPAAYIPAATVSAAVTPQTPPSPAAYTPASPAQQTTTPAPQTSSSPQASPTTPAPQTPPSTAEYPPASATSQAPTTPRIQFCRNCGFRLLDDSKFCSSCGTPVVPITKE